MKELLNRTIEFSTHTVKDRRVGKVTAYNEPGTRLVLEIPGAGAPQEMPCSAVEVHRVFEPGENPATAAPLPAAKPVPRVRWSPLTKTVMDFEDGAVDEDQTNYARERLGLPVPWKRDMLKKELGGQPVMLSSALAKEFEVVGRFGSVPPVAPGANKPGPDGTDGAPATEGGPN